MAEIDAYTRKLCKKLIINDGRYDNNLPTSTMVRTLAEKLLEADKKIEQFEKKHFCPTPQLAKDADICDCAHSDRHRAIDWASIDKLQAKIERLEEDIAKRPAKPEYGEARSRLLKAMDNSANIDDAIKKWEQLQAKIEELLKE